MTTYIKKYKNFYSKYLNITTYKKYYTIISTILIILSIVMLQACSSMLIIGTAAIVTTTWKDPRTIGTQLDDNILETYITHALNKHPQIKQFSRIQNIVYQGNVLLTGQTLNSSLANQAIQIIHNIHGTKKIYNAIRHNQPICLLSICMDSWISNQIRFKLLFMQKTPHLSNIKVITENKEVFLIGISNCIEEKYARKIAQSIYGVTNVFIIFNNYVK